MDEKDKDYRDLIECFYNQVSGGNLYHQLYLRLLKETLDHTEASSLHQISTSHDPQLQTNSTSKVDSSNYLFRSRDFPTIFLYNYLFHLLLYSQPDQLHSLHNQLLDKVENIYGTEDLWRFREHLQSKIDYIFEALEYLMQRKETCSIYGLFNKLFENLFNTLWMRRISRQNPNYQRQASIFLRILLSNNNCLISKDQLANKANYMKKFNCSFVFVDEKKKQQNKLGDGLGKIFSFCTNQNQYMIKEQHILQSKQQKKKLNSSEISQLLVQFQNLVTFHDNNTTKLAKLYGLTGQKMPQPESARFPRPNSRRF